MAACVAASIIAGIGGHVEDAKLQNGFGEVDILQAYMMAAVEIVAGEDDCRPAPAASVLLHQGGVELSAAASSLLKCITDVPREQEVVSVKAMPKILHDLREIVLSSTPVQYTGGVEEGSEFADSHMIQKVTKGVIEENVVNQTSTEHNNSSDVENSVNHLEVAPAIPSNGTAKGSDDTGEPEALPAALRAVSDSAAENRDIDECMSTDVIASQGLDGAKDTANVPGPSNDDDRGEVSEMAKGPVVNLKREAIGVLEDCDATEFNEILMDEGDFRIRTSSMNGSESESEVKVEVSSPRTTNTDAVGSVDNATTMSHSFSFTGLNHVAFCVENLERSLDFYCGLLGLKTNLDRPELPYRGAWLFLGAEGIHIMEVPNPDPVNGRPAHGGFDRHACLNCKNVEGVRLALETAGIAYQPSIVPSLFTRDPDGNGLEFIEVNS